MRRLWDFFASTWLTVVLAGLVCAVSAWGSVLTVRHSRFYRQADSTLLVDWLTGPGSEEPGLVLWIYLLVFLVTLFAVNTVVCTTDRVLSILRGGKPWKSLLPHVVHVGFLIALLGHLVSSVAGFRSFGHVVFEGSATPIPQLENVSVRLDDLDAETSPRGRLTALRSTVTIIEDGVAAETGTIEMNSPLHYRGASFLHLDQGRATSALNLVIDGEPVEAPLEGTFTAGGESYYFGTVYPDFTLTPSGRPTTRSMEYRNPVIELRSGTDTALLPLYRERATVALGGRSVTLTGSVMKDYQVLAVHRDPGFPFILAGSIILVGGMIVLLAARGERAELVRAE